MPNKLVNYFLMLFLMLPAGWHKKNRMPDCDEAWANGGTPESAFRLPVNGSTILVDAQSQQGPKDPAAAPQ